MAAHRHRATMRPRCTGSRDSRLPRTGATEASAVAAAVAAAATTSVEIQPVRELRRRTTLSPQPRFYPPPSHSATPVSPVLSEGALAPPFADLSDDEEGTRVADDDVPVPDVPGTAPFIEQLSGGTAAESKEFGDMRNSAVYEATKKTAALTVRMPDRARSPGLGATVVSSAQPIDVDRMLSSRVAHSAQPAPHVHSAHISSHIARASSPKRKYVVRAEHGSTTPSAERRSAQARARRSVTHDDAVSAGRVNSVAVSAAAPVRQIEEEDAAPSVTPNLKLTRDVTHIKDALRDSVDSADKAETVLMALAKFALGPRSPTVSAERRDALIAGDAVGLVVSVQTAHVSSAPVQAVAGWAIGSLCHEDAAMQLAFGEAGAVDAVVSALRTHEESLWVIELGLRALSALTWATRNRDAIGLCGGLDVVIATMGRHADMCTVQADGATLLANSAYGHERNKALLGSGFGLDAVVTAMRGFTRDATVQNHGCLALRNVTWALEQNKEIAGVKGAVNAVIDALDAHVSDIAVVEQAAAALSIMVDGVGANVRRMLNSSEWASVIIGTLDAHVGVESAQVNLLKVLACVARVCPDQVPLMVAAGALDTALTAMRRNVTRRAVMLAGASAAKALLMSGIPEAEAALQSAGGVAALLDMLYCSVTAPPLSPPAAHAAQS